MKNFFIHLSTLQITLSGLVLILLVFFIVFFIKGNRKVGTLTGEENTSLLPEPLIQEEASPVFPEHKFKKTEEKLTINDYLLPEEIISELKEEEISDALSDDGKFKKIPEIAKKKNDLGVEAFTKGDIEKATALYQEATEIAPHFNLALYNLGNAYFAQNNYDKAIEAYEKVILYSPRDEFAFYNLAMAYYKKGELRTATIYYRKAIEIAPGDPAVHYNLAKIYEQLNSVDQAIEAYKMAISLKPDYANAHYNLAELLKFKGLYKQAIQEYQLYLKNNPEADDQMEVKKLIVQLHGK